MNEQTISLIAEAVLANTRVLEKLIDSLPSEAATKVAAKVKNVAPAAPVVQAAPTPIAQPAPAPVAAPAPAPAVPAAPVMPAPPVFEAPAAAPAPAGAPFTDGKGLIDYVMTSYKTLGPAKGAQIQAVMTGLGYANINDVKPESYGALYAGIEALK
ncbi:hypothetical protein UFOVP254_3 [uncultured Caudovirales phage]|uniref:Uncharacterized protein n=1 Tax=uncultured Caudovirales phage TaxID=2100421 RepID=A0A6J5LE35_9CAUD|nr:hypothetical protein UFOVP76_50 [uncultured Caudovirales phage]CAB4132844.1 hypothetical protein UFOVP254_3 [uncultured Caudovirales phage]